MKILEQIGHQGDTQWYTIDSIPKTAKKINKQFIAASEKSGNVHALSGNYDIYEHEDGFIVDVKEQSVLNHTVISELNEKTWDNPNILTMRDHKPSILKKGLYFVGIQRKFNPLSKLMEKVKD